MKVLRKPQKKALEQIEKLAEKFGKDRWFVQAELDRVHLFTLNALVDKDYLDKIYYFERAYYRIREQEGKKT